MGNELGREAADALAAKGAFEDEAGPARKVDRRGRKRLVHGQHETVPRDPPLGPERVAQRRPERERRILHCMVLVDAKVRATNVAGYADVDTYYRQLIRNDSTHHLSNGQISGISLYKALRQFADAYPDPKTGANTAISTALDAKFTQVFIQHPAGDAAKAQLLTALKSASAQVASNKQ